MNDEYFMKQAIRRAKAAAKDGEVPIGAVIVKDGKVISGGRNFREKKKNALCHAELTAIDRACKKLGAWRLIDCDIYVTLEPCPMCAGAIINSRIKRVIFGASDAKAGAFGSVCDLSEMKLNHKPETVKGVMEKECASLLSDFFKELRTKSKSSRDPAEKEINDV